MLLIYYANFISEMFYIKYNTVLIYFNTEFSEHVNIKPNKYMQYPKATKTFYV